MNIRKNLIMTRIAFLALVMVISTFIVGGSSYLNGKNYDVNESRIESCNICRLEGEYEREAEIFMNWLFDKNVGNTVSTNLVHRNATNVPVLLYHGIVEESNGESISKEDFREQIYLFKSRGYDTITLEQLMGFLEKGEPLPEKSLMITFDDGRKDSFYRSDPILAAVDYNAVMFLIASRISDDQTFHLTKTEIKQMLSTGRWEIGSHSYDAHREIPVNGNGESGLFLSNKQWFDGEDRIETDEEYKNRIALDMVTSISALENDYAVKIDTFAYPYGDFGQNSQNYINAESVVRELSKQYFRLSFYQYNSDDNKNYPIKNAHFVKRITVSPELSSYELLEMLD